MDTFPPAGYIQEMACSPVIICGIPGRFETGDLIANFENGPIGTYGFTTDIAYADSVSKELGVTLPSSITTNETLRDTFGHRIHTFGLSDNDSIAIYWHGIFFDRLHGGGIDILINDSTKWAESILRRDDKQTGPP